ncbi:hypothetical protein [Tunturiibacter lichenicola]|uniref:hypothetical protein n=1 Tax=Tunturiibacter lichenicola TaxID=2051959 RepID=UPI0021B2CF31|nr:hypothetical protein [Edaphobacter lichenicola]
MSEAFWGKPEVFWVAIQSMAAIAGLIGLFFYTLYTRRMMKLSEETRRAQIKPVFSVKEMLFNERFLPSEAQEMNFPWLPIPNKYDAQVIARNVGKGAAVFISAWHQQVSERFVLANSMILKRSASATDGVVSNIEVTYDEVTEVVFKDWDCSKPWLFVIDCADTANGRHQLQGLRSPGKNNGKFEWSMVHALGDTFGERVVRLVVRYGQIMTAINASLDKMFE